MHFSYFWTGTHTHAAIQWEVTLQPRGCHCAAPPSVCACHMFWEWEANVYNANSFRPRADIKSGAAGLFHCLHSATGQRPQIYYAHCTELFNISTITFFTFHHDWNLWNTVIEANFALSWRFLLLNIFFLDLKKENFDCGKLLIFLRHKTNPICSRLIQVSPTTATIAKYQKAPKNPDLVCTYVYQSSE